MRSRSSYKPLVWKLCCIGIILLSVLTFTSLVIPAHQFEPTLSGVPYTLWVGITMTAVIMLVNAVGAVFYPGEESESGENS